LSSPLPRPEFVDMKEPRLDKVLWSLRVFKTRPQATAACRAGHVRIGELESKAGRDVHPGEVLVVRFGLLTRTLKILALPPSRVSAKQLPGYTMDLTPASEYERARQASFEHRLARERGRGRPTKKDRRALSKIFEPKEP
jgi:ribosome-associated heat shock protein Hsp15